MKIIYRVYGNWDANQAKWLKSHDLNVELGFGSFHVEEEAYLRIRTQLERWRSDISYGTLFDESEINSSKLLVYAGSWTNGYPQPETNFGYIALTYDDRNFCKTCGVGANQQSPFRVKKETNLGNKKMFSLNWVFDEIFVRKDVYEQVFKPYGLESRPVVLFKKETILENTVQLTIPKINHSLELHDHPYEVCKTVVVKNTTRKCVVFFHHPRTM